MYILVYVKQTQQNSLRHIEKLRAIDAEHLGNNTLTNIRNEVIHHRTY